MTQKQIYRILFKKIKMLNKLGGAYVMYEMTTNEDVL